MKIVTLMENTACRGDLVCEHGLSLYIETDEHKILFDAGQSGAFAGNAEKMGIDLAQVDTAILSHGHYDHGGGMGRFLEINDHAPVYLSTHAFELHYNAKGAYIGLDPYLQKNNRLRFADGNVQIDEGISLRTLDISSADTSGLTVLEDGHLRPEKFKHEQYLLIEEKGKKILFSGCSHKGILQIVKHFQPDILIGGFHFMKIEEKEILREAAEELLVYPTVYYTGHCTGEKQFAYLKTIMGQQLQYLAAGSTFTL